MVNIRTCKDAKATSSGVVPPRQSSYDVMALQTDRFWVRSEVLHEMKFKPIKVCLSSAAVSH